MSGGFRGVANSVAVINGLFGLDPVIQPVYAQDRMPVLVRVEDRTRITPTNRVVVREPSTGVDLEIYRSEGDIFDHVALSPSGRYVAFLEVVGPGGARKQRLVVVELSSREMWRYGESSVYARGIRNYAWCCGPDLLAIMTGGLAQGDPPAGESTTLPYGLSLMDIRTGGAMPIQGLRFPLQIHWAAFDSSLYIKDSPDAAPGARGPTVRPIYRYDVPTRTLSRTAHHGIFLSPDGKYYFDTGVSEASGSFALYETATDQDVTAQLAVPRHHLGPEGGWMPGADHVLIFTEKPTPQAPRLRQPGDTAVRGSRTPRVYRDRWNVAVDAGTGRVIERFQGDIAVGWKTNAAALPVEGQKGVELVRPRHP